MSISKQEGPQSLCYKCLEWFTTVYIVERLDTEVNFCEEHYKEFIKTYPQPVI